MRSLGADSRSTTRSSAEPTNGLQTDVQTDVQTDIQTEILAIQRHAHAGRARATALAVGTRSS